jgi:phage-related protein (TIGR01555 family)
MKRSKNKQKAADSVQQPEKKQRAYDAFANAAARTGFGTSSLMEATEYPLVRLTRNYQLMQSLYRSHWIVRRIIDTIPEDCCKNWYTIKSQISPDLLDRFRKTERKTNTKAKIMEAMKWGRLYGGAAAIILIEGHEDILDQPLDYETIMPGSYCGLLVRDRWSGITPGPTLVQNPRDIEYGLPDTYRVTTNDGDVFTVHHSRVIRFIGRDVPFWEKQAEVMWGVSEIEHIYDELRKRDNTSWNIANLIFRAYLITLKMKDLDQILAAGDERSQQDLYNVVQAQNWLMSNQGMLALGADDSLDSKAYSFAGLSEVYEEFMMDISGAAEIPATKLFGRSPAGMNATGDSDLQIYYDSISQKQEANLAPAIDKLLPIMALSEWGYIPDDLDYDFAPVGSLSQAEKTDLGTKGAESISKLFTDGLISQKVALKELRQQSDITGMYSNITDEDIENADDEVQQFGEVGMPNDMETPAPDRNGLSTSPEPVV